MTLPDSTPVMLPKHQKACGLCRRKKIRCDALERPDRRCSKCSIYGVECDFDRGNLRPSETYVAALESRLAQVEALLTERKVSDTPHEPSHAAYKVPPAQFRAVPPSFPLLSPDSGELEDFDSSDDDNAAQWNLLGDARRYQGESSNASLVRDIMALQSCQQSRMSFDRLPSFDFHTAVENLPPFTDFPPPDLLTKLVDAYFTHLNIYLPLLHRPSFEKCLHEGLHLVQLTFGAIVLLVCANGARWVDDPRVVNNPEDEPGAKWIAYVQTAPVSLLARPTVYDLQACALMAEWINNATSPQGSWAVLGLGISMALDLGMHRKKSYSNMSKTEAEAWKRAFWCLVLLDRVTSFGMGRPCSIQDEDFDIDPITECDDEYWSDGPYGLKQPPGKPSKVAFANCLIRLVRIVAFASRTIYTINKSKLLLGFIGPHWKQRVVAELDSALNKWVDTIPPHLRWNPEQPDPVFLNQSATLHASYYHTQICVHRQFIPAAADLPPAATTADPSPSSALPSPSLAICVTAARACLRVLGVQLARTQRCTGALAAVHTPLFAAGLVRLMGWWVGGRADAEAAADVRTCVEILETVVPYNRAAKKMLAVMRALMTPTPSELSAASSPGDAGPAFEGADDLGSLAFAVAQNLRLAGLASGESLPPPLPDADAPAEGPFYRTTDPGSDAAAAPRATDAGEALPLYTHELGGYASDAELFPRLAAETRSEAENPAGIDFSEYLGKQPLSFGYGLGAGAEDAGEGAGLGLGAGAGLGGMGMEGRFEPSSHIWDDWNAFMEGSFANPGEPLV